MRDDEGIRMAVGAWNAGMIGRAELVSRLIEAITPENVDELLKQPTDVVSMVKRGVVEAPVTEAGWRQLIVVESVCNDGTETKEERERRQAIQAQNFRRGVETLRNRMTGWGLKASITPDYNVLGELSAGYFLSEERRVIAREWVDGPEDETGIKTFLRRVTLPRLKEVERTRPGSLSRIKEALRHHLNARDFPVEEVYYGGEPIVDHPEDPYRYYEWAWEVLSPGEDWRIAAKGPSVEEQAEGESFQATIEGRTFIICTEELYEDASDRLSGQWHAWSFFAYDREMNIYPADSVPVGVRAQESIAGETRDSEASARAAVEERLRKVIRSKCLDGTGFYSPPADRIWPQEFPDKQQ
jgi:hypothetical protein